VLAKPKTAVIFNFFHTDTPLHFAKTFQFFPIEEVIIKKCFGKKI